MKEKVQAESFTHMYVIIACVCVCGGGGERGGRGMRKEGVCFLPCMCHTLRVRACTRA